MLFAKPYFFQVAYNDPGRYHFELTNFFFLKANNLLVHTNIVAYTTLGRYVLILDSKCVYPSFCLSILFHLGA